MKNRENALLIGMLCVIGMLVSLEIGQIKGYQLGKEAILELLSKYKCEGHLPMPNGDIECTIWKRRSEP